MGGRKKVNSKEIFHNIKRNKARMADKPCASELGTTFIGSSSSHVKGTGSAEKADVKLIVMKYNNDGNIYGVQFRAIPMKVIHCLHPQRPSVWYKCLSKMDQYLQVRHSEDADFPGDRRQFEAHFHAKFVYVSGTPLDEDGHDLYQPWRVAVYVDGDEESVKELLIFIDGFIAWRASPDGADDNETMEQPQIQIQLPVGFEIKFDSADESNADDMDCSYSMVYSDGCFVRITDAPPPCYPTRMLMACIESSSKNTVSIVWSGNTMPFKNMFSALLIGGVTKRKRESDTYGEYFRKTENKSIKEKEDRDAMVQLFGDELTKGSPVIVEVRSPPEDDDVFQNFVSQVKLMPNVFFL